MFLILYIMFAGFMYILAFTFALEPFLLSPDECRRYGTLKFLLISWTAAFIIAYLTTKGFNLFI